MRIIDIPGEVTFEVPVRSETGGISRQKWNRKFTEFLTECCDAYKEFAKGPKQARTYDKLMKIIEATNGAKTISFEDADFIVLDAAVQDAVWLTPSINRAYIPYYEAVEKAQSVVIPTEPKKE